MGRTRSAVAFGTAEAIRLHGARKTTMIDIASAAGIAKGTLYNHVRTRSEAYQLLAETEVGHLLNVLKGPGEITAVLCAAGEFVATHSVVRALAADEPAALAVLLLPGPLTATGRSSVLAALEGLVGVAAAPLVFRWLVSLMPEPGDADSRALEAAALASTALRLGQSMLRTQAG